MNVEAFSSLKGQQAGKWLATKFGAYGLIGIDESTTIKNHKAKRTKALMKIAAGFAYRRLLTGSPVTKSPLDLYGQTEFLRPGLLGFRQLLWIPRALRCAEQAQDGCQVFPADRGLQEPRRADMAGGPVLLPRSQEGLPRPTREDLHRSLRHPDNGTDIDVRVDSKPKHMHMFETVRW
jgi:hypothetical protein